VFSNMSLPGVLALVSSAVFISAIILIRAC